jgi:hypothetical protein
MAWRSRRPSVLVLLAAVAAVALPRPAAALVDPDPDPTRQANGRVDAVAYLGNTVYVAGSFTAVRDPSNGSTTARNRLAAFNANSPYHLLPWNPQRQQHRPRPGGLPRRHPRVRRRRLHQGRRGDPLPGGGPRPVQRRRPRLGAVRQRRRYFRAGQPPAAAP